MDNSILFSVHFLPQAWLSGPNRKKLDGGPAVQSIMLTSDQIIAEINVVKSDVSRIVRVVKIVFLVTLSVYIYTE